MLEKRKGRGGGGGSSRGGSGFSDNWDAPALEKAQMAFEIIWFCLVLYLIATLVKVMRNVPSRERQPYNLLIVSAVFLDIGLLMDAITIRLDTTLIYGDINTYLGLSTTTTLLWQQAIALITMAGLWVFRKRSKLIIYGGQAKGIPYAGRTWKFVADWIVTCCILLFLVLAVILRAAGYSLYLNGTILTSDYLRFFDAQKDLAYTQYAFYFLLTIVFVVTAFTLNSAFNRQMGHRDVVCRFPTYLRTHLKFNTGHSSDADLGHALAHHSCTLLPG
jgi:preprotein translocase subunit SecG